MDNNIKKKLRKKTIRQIFLLSLPLLLIIAAYAVFMYTLDIERKLVETEEEIYSDIYTSEGGF